jgi:hypothetical protein
VGARDGSSCSLRAAPVKVLRTGGCCVRVSEMSFITFLNGSDMWFSALSVYTTLWGCKRVEHPMRERRAHRWRWDWGIRAASALPPAERRIGRQRLSAMCT